MCDRCKHISQPLLDKLLDLQKRRATAAGSADLCATATNVAKLPPRHATGKSREVAATQERHTSTANIAALLSGTKKDCSHQAAVAPSAKRDPDTTSANIAAMFQKSNANAAANHNGGANKRPAIPPLLLGPAAKRMALSVDEKVSGVALKKAAKKIKLPEPHKERYYMTPAELRWTTHAHDLYVQHNGGKADTAWYDQLYMVGVAAGELNDKCSPGGLRSVIYRHLKGDIALQAAH